MYSMYVGALGEIEVKGKVGDNWFGWKSDPDHSHVENVAGSPLATFWQFLLVTRVSEEPYMYTHFCG